MMHSIHASSKNPGALRASYGPAVTTLLLHNVADASANHWHAHWHACWRL